MYSGRQLVEQSNNIVNSREIVCKDGSFIGAKEYL